MSVFWMKLLALASMITDHVGVFLQLRSIPRTPYLVLRGIGRFAFPVYCFLIVNGFEMTHDRARYLTRLAAFAAISEIPFVLLFSAHYDPAAGPLRFSLFFPWPVCAALIALICAVWLLTVRRDASVVWPALAMLLAVSSLEVGGFRLLTNDINVFYTLALGLALICLLDEASAPTRDLRRVLAHAAAIAAALFLIRDTADYGLLGLAFLVGLYLTRDSRVRQVLIVGMWAAVEYMAASIRLYYFLPALLSIFPILLYNGRQGRPFKLGFYALYPVHLLILGLLSARLLTA